MNRIEFLRIVAAISLASVVHLAAFYGIAAALPPPHRVAAVQLGPIVAATAIPLPRNVMQAAHDPANRHG